MRQPTLYDIARLAYERGFLDLRALLDLVYEAGRAGQGARRPDFWVRSGRLEAWQLDELLDHFTTDDRKTDPGGHDAEGISTLTLSVGDILEEQPAPPKGAPPRRAPALPSPPTKASPGVARGAGKRPGEEATSMALPEPGPPASDNTGARFRQLGVLGTGGMGQVVEFEDRRLGRRVAVKVLRHDLPDRRMPSWMLEREAKITGSLEHPNIIPVYDAGHDTQLGPYYVMRVLKQPTLHDVLSKLRQGEAEARSEYTLGRLLRYFVQVCQAVDYAHSRGVIHCDLKPANVLLGSFGEVIVVDWGFAFRVGEPAQHRGGTPGYMAPEQLDPRPDRIDGRADVFALGSILYELLSLKRAFGSPSMDELVERARQGKPLLSPPEPPSAVSEGRAVPIEIEEVCLKALAIDPGARFQTARELASAIEGFLEGTREKERRLRRAVELTDQGESLTASYDEMLASRPERVAELAALRSSIEPWWGPGHKQALWDAEDRHAVLDQLSIRTLQAAIAAYEHALDELPSHLPAKQGLARLYRRELERAIERHDEYGRVYFEGLLAQYSDDAESQREARQSRQGRLSIDTRPEGARVTIAQFAEDSRRLVPGAPRQLGPSPATLPALEPGSYLVEIASGERPVRLPVLVRAGAVVRAAVDLHAASLVLPGEVFVPSGPALLGGAESSVFGRDTVEVFVPSFAMSILPVSFADYLAFVAEVLSRDPEAGAALLPATGDGAPYFAWDGRRFAPTASVSRWEHPVGDLLRLPAIGVDIGGALAYAAWKAERTGLPYKLPGEAEWEKAARGVDGRAFPWGNHFDASFCKMRDSRSGPARPEPSGAFEADASPYGVRDMGGGVADWVLSPSDADGKHPRPKGQVSSRGGAWCDWPSDCHVASRRTYAVSERSARVGFRLARSVPESLNKKRLETVGGEGPVRQAHRVFEHGACQGWRVIDTAISEPNQAGLISHLKWASFAIAARSAETRARAAAEGGVVSPRCAPGGQGSDPVAGRTRPSKESEASDGHHDHLLHVLRVLPPGCEARSRDQEGTGRQREARARLERRVRRGRVGAARVLEIQGG